MAFRKITEGDMLGKGNVGRPDTPGVSTAEMQRIMDELPREVLAPAFNELAGQLEAETAAADIGAAAPEGVTAAPAGKLQAVLNGLRDLVKAHTDRADNPHGVTAAQAGAYSKAETDAAISAKVVELGAGDMAKSIYDPGNEQQPLLPRNGDGSNVTASFTEAEQDADIQTGDELTVLFGKIKKRFSVFASNTYGKEEVYTKTESDERYATAAQGEKADNALPKTGGTISGNLTVVQDLTVQRAFNGMRIKAGVKIITTPTTSARAELFNSDTLNTLFGTTGVSYTNGNCVVLAANGDYDFHPRVVTSGYVNSKWAVFTADAGNFTISTMRVNYIAIKFA